MSRARSSKLASPFISRRAVLRGLTFSSLLPLVVGCERPRAKSSLVQLNRGNGPEFDTLDVHKASTSEAHNVLRDLYECLTRLDKGGNAIPAAAEGWEVAADGLFYTITIRSGLRWSNGDPVVAEDFLASFRRLVDPATAAPYAQLVDMLEGASEIIAGKLPPQALGIESDDPTRLLLKLQRPAPYLPSILANVATAPLHRASYAQYGRKFIAPGALVSNGAFTLGEVLTGSHVRLLRNPHFRENARNKIDVVKFLHLADENAELRAYRANELHVTMAVPRSQYDWIKENLAKELHVAPQSGTYYYGFNLDRAPFADAPGLRRALSLVIDRERLANSVLRVGELPAYGWIPPGLPAYTSQTFDYAAHTIEAKIAEAKALYKAAGYSASRPLRFSLSYNAGEVHNKLAVAVASMWKAALGVDVALDAVEFRSLLERIERRDVDMYRLAWRGDYNDPYTFLQALQSTAPTNSMHFRSAEFDQLLAQGLEASEDVDRRRLFENAERVLLAQHPLIPLYFYVNKHLVKPTVRGWYNNPLDVLYSHDLSLTDAVGA